MTLSGLTPLPFWPFKALVYAADYPLPWYLVAVALGRFPRYLLLAWLGKTIAFPSWSLTLLCLALLVPGLIRRRRAATNRSPKEATVSNPSEGNPVHKAQRVRRSLTADWERRVLPRMARALPAWVTPDHLTLLGISAAFIIAQN